MNFKELILASAITTTVTTLDSSAQNTSAYLKDTHHIKIYNNDSVIQKRVFYIDQLRIKRIDELNDFIRFYQNVYDINSNFEKFKKLKILEHEDSKRVFESTFEKWKSINLDSLSDEQVMLLINYTSRRKKDSDIPFEKRENIGESNESENINKKMIEDKNLMMFYSLNIGKYNDLVENFSLIIDSIDKNENPKKRFMATIEKIINFYQIKYHYQDDVGLEESIKNSWNNRELPESIMLKINEKQKELYLTFNYLDYSKLSDIINSSRSWFLENIASNNYYKKLIGEGFSPDIAKIIQQERFNRLLNVSINLDPIYFNYSRFEDGMIFLNPIDIVKNGKYASIHEEGHAETDGDFGISEKAKSIYREALINDDKLKEVISHNYGVFPNSLDNTLSYWKGFSELNTRKKELEVALHDFNIIKGNEIMTHKHYLKLLELMKNGELDHNCVQIILMTTEEGLIKIINEIA